MGVSYTKKDFVSKQEVRWCPGCGDYAILSAVQKTLPELGIPREKFVFISGIGCSSRFPYYMNTYGFHTIHGRAPAFATGLALSRPDLSVWVITGDGDGLSIGGNHLVHALRRNININILLFNNQTYGLTKGQYSPTSHKGTISKSTPFGSIDRPFSPLSLALGAGATFAARTHDKDQRHMGMIFERAVQHPGAAFIEIYQNCVIFNKDVFEDRIGKEERHENLVFLEDQAPLLFGKEKEYGLRINDLVPEKVSVKEAGLEEVHIHRENLPTSNYAFLLSQLDYPKLPQVMGVLYDKQEPAYEEELARQSEELKKERGIAELEKLLRQGDTWQVA